MAFIVEDGTQVSEANSYITVDFFRNYFDERDVNVSYNDTDIQRAAVKATDYVEMLHSTEFVGQKKDSEQALSWPRSWAYDRHGVLIDDTIIPSVLKKAVAEYALRALSGALAPDPVYSDSTGVPIVRRRSRVGPIEEEFEYAEGGTVTQIFKSYPVADKLLYPILNINTGRVIRG